ncbi:DENN domain-containing protein 2A-like isoform X2 [Littorina saxatilis]|uniref:DENN domain-containing protein 2A-like isoform X2 n=1 Tax=Littorina saxatilis TaxID=31220 RepID=UPI0038B46CA3
MSDKENSVKKLPPGKLQSLKELFEERDAQATGPPIFGVSPPKTPGNSGRPVSNFAPPRPTVGPGSGQPKAVPRHGSPVRKTWMTPDLAVLPTQVKVPTRKETSTGHGTLPRPRQRRTSEKQEWSTSTLERKSTAQKKIIPTVSRRVTLFTDTENANGERNGNSEAKTDVQRRIVPPSVGPSSPKRLSDPSTVKDGTWKRHTGDRRRTVDNVALPPEQKPSEVKVLQQLKKFETKPSLPQKPVVPVIGQNMPSVSNAQRRLPSSSEQNNTNYELPWDVKPGKNIERLKAITDGRSSGPLNILTGKDNTESKPVTGPLSPPKTHAAKHTPRPLEQPPPPPPSKPPRTYKHDEYLETKGPAFQNTVKDKGPEEAGYNVSTVKERITNLNDGNSDKLEVVLRDAGKESYAHLGQKETKGGKGIRETPPSRPPPPRPRPISEGSALHRRQGASPGRSRDGSDSESEGPVVISLKHGRRLGRQVSVSHPRRRPDDQLPDTPEYGGAIQRYPLRKSFSSECLHKGSKSSLAELGVDEDSSQASMMRSYHPQASGEPLYEALIDSEGYAVPHKFLRIQLEQENGQNKGSQANNKPGFLKGVLGPTTSSGAAAPAVPATTPLKEQNVDKVPRRKMNLVKQKINQAYEVLHTVFQQRPPTTSEEEDSWIHVESQLPASERDSTFISYLCGSSDSDSVVDVQEIRRRVTYCTTVRSKTHQSVKKAREFLDKIYPQLFEYALIVGLRTKTDNPGYEAFVIHKFPQTVNSNISVPKFCFPDAEEFRPGSATASESYSFVLTNIDGGRLFGYCRRMQPRDASLPEVICIISPVDAFNMYNILLSEIETRRLKSLDHAQEMMAASFGRPLPKPGKVCHIRCLNESGDMETVFLKRSSDHHLGQVNYESLLLYLGTEKLIKVFASMLMERRLILCSNHLSILTQTIHALVALLYPFHWPHVYIPLLPPDMLDVCAAPMPFMVGILQSHLSRVTELELEDVIIVDLDKKQVLRSMGDELTILPKKVQKALKTAINMCKIDSDARSSQWLMVSEAFMRMFLETMGHFGQHVFTQQDGSKTLLKEQYIAAAPSKGIRQFLEWFTETQMFEVFINLHQEKEHWGSMDLFMQRLGELQAKRQTEGSQAKGLGQKVKNFGKAIKTKLKEAT